MTPDPLVSVARGAAVACYWREARGVEIVQPIMPEDFGVFLRDGRQVPLIAARHAAALSRRATASHDVTDDGAPFSVPTDNAATLLVPFYTGDRRPSPPGRHGQGARCPADVAAGHPGAHHRARGGGQDPAVVVPHRRGRGAARARGGRSLDDAAP